jgi:hypothetical protein
MHKSFSLLVALMLCVLVQPLRPQSATVKPRVIVGAIVVEEAAARHSTPTSASLEIESRTSVSFNRAQATR